MDSLVIALVIGSAVLHPLRDLILKGVGDGFAAYGGVCLVWVILAAIETVAARQSLVVPSTTIMLAAISAAGLIAYYAGTLLAMRRGELSVAYPIIRSSPVAIVLIGWFFLGHAHNWRSLGAIVLIVLAGFLLQRRPGRMIGQPRAMTAALIAMFGSAVYAIADSRAMQSIDPAPFLFWVYICVTAGLVVVGGCVDRRPGGEGPKLVTILMRAPGKIIGAGAISYLSYRLILAAFQMGGEPAGVTAVRQVSIPVSILLAALVLGETEGQRKLVWGGLMAVGIAFLATG